MRSLLVVVGFALACAVSLHASPSVSSDFTAPNVDGWGLYSGGDPSSVISWATSVENPAYIQLKEGAIGKKDYFQAPAKFTGDKSLYYGGTLSFDLKVSSILTPTTWRDDIVLVGANNVRLIHTFAIRPGLEWNSWSISLEAGSWYYDTGNHSGSLDSATWAWSSPGSPPRLATETELRSVLSDISILLIKSDYRAGDETVSLDNVTMAAPVPEPGTLGLVLLGACVAVIMMRRRISGQSTT